MTPIQIIVGLISAALSSFGFAILFRVRKKHLFATAVGGLLGYAIYLPVAEVMAGEFIPNFLGALLCAIFCTICSHGLRAPVQIYLIPVLIPLFPGGSLYYAMYYLLAKNYEVFSEYAIRTMESALGIAGGMLIGLAVAKLVHTVIRKFRPKRANNDEKKAK